MTYGDLDTRLRRDVLSIASESDSRFTAQQTLSALNRAALEVTRVNPWAGYGADGSRIYNILSHNISAACDTYTAPSESTVAALRAMPFPLLDRYADAVCYRAAATLLAGADRLDAVSNQYSQLFAKRAEEAAWL